MLDARLRQALDAFARAWAEREGARDCYLRMLARAKWQPIENGALMSAEKLLTTRAEELGTVLDLYWEVGRDAAE